MYHEEAVNRILGRSSLEFPEIDQNRLRLILEDILYNYEMQPQTKALTTLSDLFERIADYLIAKKLRGQSDKTIYNYRLQLMKFSKYINLNVNEIEAIHIRQYLAIISKEKVLKQTSKSNIISILKSFFSWMYIQGYTTRNIMEKIENIKCEKRLRKPLDSEEMERLRTACTSLREMAILLFLYSTGMRLSELVNVNVGDLNWDKKSLRVIGKGNKERIVYFSPSSKVHLENYLNSRENITKDSPLFISSKYPHGRLGNRAIEVEIHNIQNKAGVGSSVFPHRLRTTSCTHMISRGVSLSSIQRICGHQSPNVTQRYAQINDEMAQQEYNKYFAQ